MTTTPPSFQAERQRILDDADETISINRASQYGDAQDNFSNIATIWTVILGIDVDAKQVALMLAGLKMARLTHDYNHRDSWVDLIGYAALGAEVQP